MAARKHAVRVHRNPDPFILGSVLADHPVITLAIAGGIIYWARNPQKAQQLAGRAGISTLPAPPTWATSWVKPSAPTTSAAPVPGTYKAPGT